MNLGINGWRIHGDTGVPRYLQNVLKHWSEDAIGGRFQRVNLYLPAPLQRVDVPEPVRKQVLAPEWRMLVWENGRLPFIDDDLLFCPLSSRPLLSRAKCVVTVHDALPALYPALFPRSTRWLHSPLYGWSARHAVLVITVSEAAKQDIIKCWKVPPSRIRVTHLAAAEAFRPLPGGRQTTVIRKKYVGSTDPFFLFVGKMTGRRSMPLLFEAFAELKRRTSLPHRLIAVGSNSRNLALSNMLRTLGISEHVRCPGYVPDDELNHLYNAADALVSPALYETMSLPAMEAQATGTPVIALDVPALREITGGAARLISGPRVPAPFEAMSLVGRNADLRSELSEKGLRNAQLFSWKRCASETLNVLHEAATLNPPSR